MGRRDIVEFLLEKGARIDLFCAAMMGQLDAVKAFLTLQPKLIDAKGPHGFTPALPRPGRRQGGREGARLPPVGQEGRAEAGAVPEETQRRAGKEAEVATRALDPASGTIGEDLAAGVGGQGRGRRRGGCLSDRKRTLPSQKRKLQPPGCRLRKPLTQSRPLRLSPAAVVAVDRRRGRAAVHRLVARVGRPGRTGPSPRTPSRTTDGSGRLHAGRAPRLLHAGPAGP